MAHIMTTGVIYGLKSVTRSPATLLTCGVGASYLQRCTLLARSGLLRCPLSHTELWYVKMNVKL